MTMSPAPKRVSRTPAKPKKLVSVMRIFHIFGEKGFAGSGLEIHHARERLVLHVRSMGLYKD